jgi:hypothetical protein
VDARLACAAVAGSLAVALAACDSDERQASPATSAGATTSSPSAPTRSTTTTVAVEEDAETEPKRVPPARLPRPLKFVERVQPVADPPSAAELRWLGRYNRWWRGASGDLRSVADEARAILGGVHVGAQQSSPLRRSLDRLARCKSETSRTLFGAPTKRLRRLYERMGKACFAVEGVADSGLQMLLYGGDRESPAKWLAEWRAAKRLLDEVDRNVAAYDPALATSLPTIGGLNRESRIEPFFGRVASRLAGKRVRVQCWGYAGWADLTRHERLYSSERITTRDLGFARFGSDVANLSPAACDGLVLLVYLDLRPAGGRRQLGLSGAVDTLSHEALHSRGVADEATTECFALQRVERTARLLGVERGYARRLAQVAWKRGYRLFSPEYRSPECRDGGALDLRPKSSRWP